MAGFLEEHLECFPALGGKREIQPVSMEVELVAKGLYTAIWYFEGQSLRDRNAVAALNRVESLLVGPRFKDAFSKTGVLAIIRDALVILDEAEASFLAGDLQELLTKIEAIEVVA